MLMGYLVFIEELFHFVGRIRLLVLNERQRDELRLFFFRFGWIGLLGCFALFIPVR